MESLEVVVKQRLAAISDTSPDDWFLVSRARHGMQVVFTTIGDKSGRGSIATQAFTCITAVNPIIEAGFTPVYVDISSTNFSMDTKMLSSALDKETGIVVVQHTFGATADVSGVRSGVGKAILVEDAAHCLGVIAKDNSGMPLADVSFHSFGAEKMLSTRFGAAVWINPDMQDKELRHTLATTLEGLPRMSIVSRIQTALYPYLNALFNRLPYRKGLRRLASDLRVFVSPIMPVEYKGRNFGRAERLSGGVLRRLDKSLRSYEAVVAHRQEVSSIYQGGLASADIELPQTGVLPYVRYPLLCRTPEVAESLFALLAARGFGVGKWYRPVLFPGADDLTAYAYNSESSPMAEEVAARIINLPTGRNITPDIAKEIIDEINNHSTNS